MSVAVPDLSELVAGLPLSLGGPAALLAGLLLLLFGRRLYWLLAGVVGFVAAFLLVPSLLPELGHDVTLVVSLIAGIAGAVIVVFAHKLLLGLVGGVGGGLVALWQVQSFGVERGLGWLLAAILGAALGAWLVSRVFEVALALISSLIGAELILSWVTVAPAWRLAVYLGLVLVGLFFQLLRSRRGRRRRRWRSERERA